MAYGGNFYAIVRTDDLGLDVLPRGQATDCWRPGSRSWTAINEQRPVVHPEDPDDRRLPPRLPRGAGIDARSTRGTRWRSTPAGSTARRAARARAPAWPSCTRAGALRVGDELVNESFIGSRFIGRVARRDDRGRAARHPPPVTGRAWVTGTAQYLLDPTDPFPAGFLL